MVRNLRAVAELKPSQDVPVIFITNRKSLTKTLSEAKAEIKSLTNAKSVDILDQATASQTQTSKSLAGVTGVLQVILPIEGLVDINALRLRLEKDMHKADTEITTLSNRLKNPAFSEKAPSEVVSKCKEKLEESIAQFELAKQRLKNLA